MKDIVLLLTKNEDLKNEEVDSFLIPVRNLSTRSKYELSLEEICRLRKATNKNIYLLCDRLISETEIEMVRDLLSEIFRIGDLVFFQDFLFLIEGKDYLKKLVYYSPTLLVNNQDLSVLLDFGLRNFILSKENTYQDYKKILSQVKNINLGMLCFGYPQIYYSKRKMISSFKEQYNIDFIDNNLFIKERTRDFYQPIYEDQNGTFIFAGKVFFPYKNIKEFYELGMSMFVIDMSFIVTEKDIPHLVNESLMGKRIEELDVDNYLLFEEMVNDYGK